ncbi:MAG: cofilin [Chrysothrix sp. TS-e1954]|nr:MAG: cofilin [Chrysothrix sp. TS-e1954]
MAQSGVSVTPDCITQFNDLKLGKSIKWIIYKISDTWKEIVVEETSTTGDYEAFREKLVNAKSKGKDGKEGKGPRYAVFDLEYDATGGEGKRSKITFIAWSPDDALLMVWVTEQSTLRLNELADKNTQPKMMYSSSKDALKRSLNGLAADVQANDEDDIEYDTVIKKVSRGR